MIVSVMDLHCDYYLLGGSGRGTEYGPVQSKVVRTLQSDKTVLSAGSPN